MFAADVLKVLYAPHKVFKQIVQNPKYWGPLLIIVLFVAAQTGWFFAQYSRTYYEETKPTIGQLTSWTENPSLWTVSPTGSAITDDYLDIMNTTFYGNSSIQFSSTNSSSISMKLNDLNGTVNCGPNGFKDMYMQIKILEPTATPKSASLTLFSQSTSNSLQYDLTSMFSNASSLWNNYTIPVATGDWKATGNPDWSKISSLQLSLTFAETANITLRIGGLFFRGLYHTPIDTLGTGYFAANALFSSLFSFIVQWLAFSVIFYLIIKLMKGPVTWKPLFISMAFGLTVFVVQAILSLAATATFPSQVRFPFEFAYSFSPTGLYPAQVVAMFSSASQTVYNSVIAPELVTPSTIAGIITLITYAWLAIVGSAIVRSITEFSWSKSILASGAGVVLTYVVLSLLAGFGFL